jgi:adenosine deaminase
MLHPLHQVLLRDRRALQRGLRDPRLPTADDVREELLRLVRETDTRQTDSRLDLDVASLLAPRDALGSILRRVLGDAVAEHLEESGRPPLVVRRGRLGDWQALVTDCPPLVLVAQGLLSIVRHPLPGPGSTAATVDRYLEDAIRPQVRHSVLPAPRDPRLEELIEREGLDDLHFHLMGSTETEHVFLDALARPKGFIEQVVDGAGKREVQRQFQQEERGLSASELLRRLRIYRQLRWVLAQAALTRQFPRTDHADRLTLPAFLFARPGSAPALANAPDPWPHRPARHPIEHHFGLRPDGASTDRLARETLLWMYLLDAAETHPDDRYAPSLHLYLLGLAQFHRLLVQQGDQHGFDQFQRITLNGLREDSERNYGTRFRQLGRGGEMTSLEGRLAPKSDRGKLGSLLTQIGRGWAEVAGVKPSPRRLGPATRSLGRAEAAPGRAHLRLVVHFIKERDRRRASTAGGAPGRHLALRNKLDEQWQVLSKLLDDYPALADALAGFDAAANELHAPPEVFAPLYRAIRSRGLRQFTYHVGEDFIHLVSGLRAMYEAMEFLELGPGDRLGHGTAMGVEPVRWRDGSARTIALLAHDRLDDLVFARTLLSRGSAPWGLGRLDDEIARLSRRIYQRAVEPPLLHDAWSLRTLDPRTAHRLGLGAARAIPALSSRRREEIRRCRAAASQNPEAFALFQEYHAPDVMARGRDIVRVEAVAERGPLDLIGLRTLQELLAAEVRQRGLVLESLPTSNVRISVYRRHDEHHIFRWLGLDGDVPIPVVLGTDDPGIFATSMRAEYAHLLEVLDRRCPGEGEEAIRHVETLVRNGKRYRFRPFGPSRAT